MGEEYSRPSAVPCEQDREPFKSTEQSEKHSNSDLRYDLSRGVVRSETEVGLGQIQGASYTLGSLARSVVNSGVAWSDLSFRQC